MKNLKVSVCYSRVAILADNVLLPVREVLEDQKTFSCCNFRKPIENHANIVLGV